ncbi:MAG: DoxX family protein [Ginsengibacter sp.]
MKHFFSPSPLWQYGGIAIIRILTGTFLIFHGWEIFSEEKMTEYLQWDFFKNNTASKFLVYAGKASELISGILLALGLLTRVACIIIAVTFIYISCFLGSGKVWYEDQHPFLFVLLAFMFFFTGPGKWSLDNRLFQKNNH